MAGQCPNEIDHSRIIPFKISYPLTLFKSLFPPQTASKFPTKLPPFTLIRPGAIPKVPMSIVAAWAAEEIKDRPLRARVEVIAEPLKARIITKGEALAYHAAMPLQKDSWRCQGGV